MFLVPTLIVQLYPPLFTGDSGEDSVELGCTAIVEEDIILAAYQFVWLKEDTPISLSNDRIVVCIM